MHKRIFRRNGKKSTPTISAPSPLLPQPIMSPITLDHANPQTQCPLLNRIPGEVRNQIFSLAVTYHSEKQEPYPKNEYYYRPNFRYADNRLCTALLRTCRRIYAETKSLPAQNYVRVAWHKRAPPNRPNGARQQCSVHLFMQQCNQEGLYHNFDQVLHEAANLQRLKITIRHSDWWNWESSAALLLDAKQAGTANRFRYSTVKEGFEERSWGNQLRRLPNLKVFELELETVEGKRNELDQIVVRAAEWQFPSGDGNPLVMNPAKTKKRGWIGLKLLAYLVYLHPSINPANNPPPPASGTHVPNPHYEAKARLERDGVDFTVPDGEREINEADGMLYYIVLDLLTYYVVTLVYERTPKPTNQDRGLMGGIDGSSGRVDGEDGGSEGDRWDGMGVGCEGSVDDSE